MIKYDSEKLLTAKLMEEAKADGVITADEAIELMQRMEYTSNISRQLLEEEIRRFDGPLELMDDLELSSTLARQSEKVRSFTRLEKPPSPAYVSQPLTPTTFPMSETKKRNIIFAAITLSSSALAVLLRLLVF